MKFGAVPLCILLTLLGTPATAQVADTTGSPVRPARIATGVVPDTVTVGEPFTVIVRVASDPTARVTLQLVSDSAAAVQPLAAATVSTDSAGTIFVQRFVAWRTGQPAAPEMVVRVAPLEYRVRPRVPFVRSVLPADTAALQPKPPKPPVGAPNLTWRLATIGALLLLAALAAWARRRAGGRGASHPAHPAGDPRAEALALLAEARAGGLLESGAWAAFYSLVSEALRISLAARSRHWARDLTTRELAAQSTPEAPVPPPLLAILERADRAKFAAAATTHATPEIAAADWTAVEAWVRSTDALEQAATAGGAGEAAP